MSTTPTQLKVSCTPRMVPVAALVALLLVASAPSSAAVSMARPARAEISANAGVATLGDALGAVAHWFGSVWHYGQSAVTVIWSEYGIAIDPDGHPVDPSHTSVANGGSPTVN